MDGVKGGVVDDGGIAGGIAMGGGTYVHNICNLFEYVRTRNLRT